MCSSLSHNFLHDRGGQPETIFGSPNSGSNFCISHIVYSSNTRTYGSNTAHWLRELSQRFLLATHGTTFRAVIQQVR